MPLLVVGCSQKESAMLNRLLLMWRKFRAWMMPSGAVPPVHHDPSLDAYRPSNLHARHHR
jgi:hypothetical protein